MRSHRGESVPVTRWLLPAAILLIAACVWICPAAEASSDLPAVRPDHPRLGFEPRGAEGAGAFDTVRRLFREHEAFRSYLLPTVERATADIENANSDEPLRGGPHTYAACWVATGEDRFAEAGIARLLEGRITLTATSSYYSNAWYFALAYDWLYHHPAMTAGKRERIEERIAAALWEELVELDGSYPAVWHGRNQLTNNTLVAALSLSVHPDREELQRRAMLHFADAARALAMSEGWPEGPSYWINNRAFPYGLAAHCFITATGTDRIGGVGLREMIRRTAYWHVYATRPDGRLASFGDAHPTGPARRAGQWVPVQEYYAKICRDPVVAASADYWRSLGESDNRRRRQGWATILSYDPEIPMPPGYDPARAADYLNERLPRAEVFGRDAMGQVFLVERWGDPDATWISFKAGDVLAHHGHYDQGNFTIFRGSPLAVQSGYYQPGDNDYVGPYHLGYYIQTIAANSLLVQAPGEFSNSARENGYFDEVTGGQRVIIPTGVDLTSVNDWRRNQHAGAHYEAGDILSFESAPGRFDYVAADITHAYNSTRYAEPGNPAKVSSVVRKLIYLREPKAVVVLDRVVTTDPKYPARWLLHTPAKPKTTVERYVAGTSPDDGIVATDNRWLETAFERGRLFHQVLLPASGPIRKIGGPTYHHYVELSSGGTNLEPEEKSESVPPSYGVWRTEVTGRHTDQDHLFVNVLWPRLADQEAPSPAALVEMRDPGLAVVVGDWVVVAAREGQFLPPIEYQSPRQVRQHLVVDLPPRSRWQIETAEGVREALASDEGVLSFEASSAFIRLDLAPPRNGVGHH